MHPPTSRHLPLMNLSSLLRCCVAAFITSRRRIQQSWCTPSFHGIHSCMDCVPLMHLVSTTRRLSLASRPRTTFYLPTTHQGPESHSARPPTLVPLVPIQTEVPPRVVTVGRPRGRISVKPAVPRLLGRGRAEVPSDLPMSRLLLPPPPSPSPPWLPSLLRRR